MSDRNQDNRSYVWATVVYEESAAANWLSVARDLKIPFCCSPLHDKDTNGTGETPKKAHWHIMFMFNSKKSREQFQEVVLNFGGVGCERVRDRRAYARYLCHLDNPEKAQYDISGVVSYVADYIELIGLPSDKYEVLSEIFDFIEKYNIRSYSTLVLYARHKNQKWFHVLCDSSTLLLSEYIKSREWSSNNAVNEFASLMSLTSEEEEQ